MTKIFIYCCVALIFFSGAGLPETQEQLPCQLCHLLSPEMVSRVKISQKNTDTGMIVVMTCADPDTVKELQRRMFLCQAKLKKTYDSGHREAMSMKGVDTEITNLNNGILLVLRTDDPELLKRIQAAVIPSGSEK
jgi:hypothetical protein